MKYLTEFRDGEIAQRMAREIHAIATRPWKIMEVCGGQTHSIIKNGIDQMLPVGIEIGLAVLDACRDAANGWVFPEAGPAWTGIRDAYVATSGSPTHFVDVTATIDAGVASLREHRAYLEGLGRAFDPDEFLKNMAGFVGLAADCEYAVAFHRYPMA